MDRLISGKIASSLLAGYNANRSVQPNRKLPMVQLTTEDLLLAPKLDAQQVTSLLQPYGFQDIKKADANLQLIAEDPQERALFAEILEECLRCFAQTPSPDQALNHFERFARTTYSKTHLISYLRQSPRTLWLASKVFGSSPFFSEVLIRNPEYFYWLFDPEVLEKPKKRGDLSGELSNTLRLLKAKREKVDFLRIFKRKEILRIGVRDLLRTSSVEETLQALTDLAEVLIQNAYRICEKEMRRKYGVAPFRSRSGGGARGGFTVLAMGKLGGGELNFSSDVDLMYLYSSRSGKSSGGRGKGRLSSAVYFERLSKEITAVLNAVTDQGYVYRVDLRLRPEGETGLIATPFQGYRRYYASRGETWERLSLVKVRPVAGDRLLGRRFLKMAHPFIYGRPFGPKGFREVRLLKERIDRKVSGLQQTSLDVKRGIGGIREIEFIVQSLQVAFGGKDLKIRERNTNRALRRLAQRRYLSQEEAFRLSAAYRFLRDVENKLQMVRDQQTHLLPTDPADVRGVALRLNYQERDPAFASDQLLNDYRFHTERVHQIFRRVFY